MDPAAYLLKQGWKGTGHSLGANNNGLKKPLLISKKIDVLGIGINKHDVSDQWWMRAFDSSLQNFGTGKQGLLGAVKEHGIKRGGLYGRFVRGEGVAGTFGQETEDAKAGGEAVVGEKRKRWVGETGEVSAPVKKKREGGEDGADEKSARKEARRKARLAGGIADSRSEEKNAKRAAKRSAKSQDSEGHGENEGVRRVEKVKARQETVRPEEDSTQKIRKSADKRAQRKAERKQRAARTDGEGSEAPGLSSNPDNDQETDSTAATNAEKLGLALDVYHTLPSSSFRTRKRIFKQLQSLDADTRSRYAERAKARNMTFESYYLHRVLKNEQAAGMADP